MCRRGARASASAGARGFARGGGLLSLRHHGIAARAKLAVRIPVGPLVAVGQLAAEEIERLDVLQRAAEIPAGIECVVWRVVAMRRVIRGCCEPRRASALDEVEAGTDDQRRHTRLREAEVI